MGRRFMAAQGTAAVATRTINTGREEAQFRVSKCEMFSTIGLLQPESPPHVGLARASARTLTSRVLLAYSKSRGKLEMLKTNARTTMLPELVLEYLHWCFATRTPPQAKELACLLKIDRSTLHRLCVTELGEAPAAILKRGQLEYANDLSHAALSRHSAAVEAAFGTFRTFCRARRRASRSG